MRDQNRRTFTIVDVDSESIDSTRASLQERDEILRRNPKKEKIILTDSHLTAKQIGERAGKSLLKRRRKNRK